MSAYLQLLLVAALPAFTGLLCAEGEVVSVLESPEFTGTPPALVLAAGSSAELDCRVLHLADKAISWVRSRDLQILSHSGAVFTADPRVSVSVSGAGSGAASGATRHTLRIERLRLADAGRYECQVNTEPKMSQFFNLTVLDEVVPETVVSAVGGRAVRGRAGGAATLACEARYEPAPRRLPLPALHIRWYFGDQPIDSQSNRGGVSLDTDRWAGRCVSRLTLAALSARDAGRYRCVAGRVADTLRLDVAPSTEESLMEAMQRDQSATAGLSAGATSSVALWLHFSSLALLLLLVR
ncbi:obscurin [Amyelois transitella]|uniref:obscurin n=1 Tax=Amyelois transitella TaxID=680683 RepID=UPI00298FD7CC|nr:obscurin [Amyelois transitella]